MWPRVAGWLIFSGGNNTFVPPIGLQDILITYFSLQTFSLLDEFFLLIKSVLCSRGGARSSKVCHEGNRNVWRKWLMPTCGGDSSALRLDNAVIVRSYSQHGGEKYFLSFHFKIHHQEIVFCLFLCFLLG